MPDYKYRDPKGWCGDPTRGAALGRHAYHHEEPQTVTVRLTLRRVYLNGDYDTNGTYWGGGGPPLYWCADEDGDIDYCLRARDRADAKRKVLEKYPHAKFWR